MKEFQTLKPCPFCDAGSPNLLSVRDLETPEQKYAIREGWVIECKTMGCVFNRTRVYRSQDQLIEEWNERYIAPS